MVKSIAERHRDIDYILLTGDFPAHDIWRQSRKDNLASSKAVVDIVRKHFPSKSTHYSHITHIILYHFFSAATIVADWHSKYPLLSDTPAYPAVGNHESFPVNMFPDPSETTGKFSPSWLYSGLADLYQKWLPGEEQQTTLRQAGYFSVSTDMSKKGRRIGCVILRGNLECVITQHIL